MLTIRKTDAGDDNVAVAPRWTVTSLNSNRAMRLRSPAEGRSCQFAGRLATSGFVCPYC